MTLEGVPGFEPGNKGFADLCLTTWLYSHMGRSMGIEPTNVGATIRCVNHFATTAIMVGTTGFEPATSPTPRVRATELRYVPTTYKYSFWLHPTGTPDFIPSNDDYSAQWNKCIGCPSRTTIPFERR